MTDNTGKSNFAPDQFKLAFLHPRYWMTWLLLPLLFILAWLPWQLRHWLGERIGDLIYRQNNKRRRIVLVNLQLCFPELSINERDQLTRHSLREYACALLDYSILFFRSRKWLYQRTHIYGKEQLDQAIKAGDKIILLLGHSVWLEFAPVAIGQFFSAYGSYKPFNNAVLNWLIASSRLKDVEFVVAREDGMIKLVRSLQPDRLLFFLPDEDHGEKHSVFAPFFATSKATLTTPARMAKISNAKAFPIMSFFDPVSGQYQIHIGSELEHFGNKSSHEDAAQMNNGFQKLIETHENQYMWLLKLFKTAPEGKVRPY